MKLTRERMEFEGTVTEYREALLQALFDGKASEQSSRTRVTLLDRPAQTPPAGPDAYVPAPAWATAEEQLRERMAADAQFVRRVMERLPLKERQQQLFSLLLKLPPVSPDTKEDTDCYLKRDKICVAMGITSGGLNGLLGPLGSRVNATQRDNQDTMLGIGVLFFFLKVDGMWAYALRPVVRRWLMEFFEGK